MFGGMGTIKKEEMAGMEDVMKDVPNSDLPPIRPCEARDSLRIRANMPKMMDGNFYGHKFSCVDIDDETYETLKDLFIKFVPCDAPLIEMDNKNLEEREETEERLDPSYMQKEFEKIGLDKDYPSMYYMVKWMAHEHSHSGGFGLSFEGFIE